MDTAKIALTAPLGLKIHKDYRATNIWHSREFWKF
jgi:hypothetical protein